MKIHLVYWTLCLLCWGYALIFGGAAARWTFALFALATLGTMYAVPAQAGIASFDGLNVPLFVTDTAYLVGLYALALRFRKYWLVWSTGLQLMCVLTHFGPMIDSLSDPKIYRALESVWMIPMLITMVIGISKDRGARDRRGLTGTAAR